MKRIACLFALSLCLPALSADPVPLPPPPRPGPPEPISPADLNGSIDRGVTYLLKNQNKDGSWGTPERTKWLNIMADVPGSHNAFRMGCTTLCIAALIDVGGDSDEYKKAVERAEEWIFENVPKLRRATPEEIYNVWGHGYAVLALAKMYHRLPNDAERKKKIEELLRGQFEMLERYESVDGGWGYYDMSVGAQKPAASSTPFVNAAVLCAFYEAKDIVPPPEKLVKRAMDSTIRQRLPDFSYLYGEYLKWMPQHGINKPGGSLGRSQACNLATRLWGDKRVTDQVLIDWLDRLITRQGWLDIGRKRPIPHESHFAVAGYFYYFGHYYASGCIKQLPPEKRPFYQDHLAKIIMSHQEQDGCWWDYALYNYGFSYGTAYGLMTLNACRK